MNTPVKWTKTEARSAWQAVSSGALEATLGRVDPESSKLRVRLEVEHAPELAVESLRGLAGVFHDRAKKNAEFVAYVEDPDCPGYRDPAVRAELAERFRKLSAGDMKAAKKALDLAAKIERHGLPPKLGA